MTCSGVMPDKAIGGKMVPSDRITFDPNRWTCTALASCTSTFSLSLIGPPTKKSRTRP